MTSPDAPIEVTMPPGSVVITPAQMYVEIRAMGAKLDHLAAVLDPSLSSIREDIGGVRDDMSKEIAASKLIHDDHEARIRSLDKRLWAAAVVAAGTGAGIAQVIPLLSR